MNAQQIEDSRFTGRPLELFNGIVHTAIWGAPDLQTEFVNSERNYPFYFAIGSILKPASVLEIGVRLGYSLISIFRGNPQIKKIIGIDIEADWPDSQQKAKENLHAVGYRGELDLPKTDSRWLHGLPINTTFDLIHVDARHTYEAVQADISRAWTYLAAGGVLVADDTDYAPDVKKGIEGIKASLAGLSNQFYFPTYRGWWIAEKAR